MFLLDRLIDLGRTKWQWG